MTAATVLRDVPSGKLVTRAAGAVAPQAATPAMTRRRRFAKPGISCTVRIPSPSIAWRKCSLELRSSPVRRKRSLKATLGTSMRALGTASTSMETHAMTPNTNTMKFECIVLLRRDDTAQPRAGRNRHHGSTRGQGLRVRVFFSSEIVFGTFDFLQKESSEVRKKVPKSERKFRSHIILTLNPRQQIPLARITRKPHNARGWIW